MKKAIKGFFITLLVIVVLVAGGITGGYFYVRSNYGIDLIKTYKNLNTLNKTVSEEILCLNPFTAQDMVTVQEEVNNSVENFITHSITDGYGVDFSNVPSEMKDIIKLTDRQVGALAQTVVQQEMKGQIDFGWGNIGLQILQVDFSQIVDGGTNFNVIVKLDMSSVQAELTDFPFSLFQRFVPDYIYLSSTVKVEKGLPFEYRLSHHSLTANKLSGKNTEELFDVLNTILQMGTAKELNEKIGNAVVGSLIGSETQTGMAYSLKEIGATDYRFITDGTNEYFVVEVGGLS